MAFDGIVAKAIALELDTALEDSRVDKIYQPGKDELLFIIRTHSDRLKVYASCNGTHPGIFLSKEEYDNPLNAPAFCMLLRKHLQGSRLISVQQKDCDRVVEISFETRNELGDTVIKKCVFEIMGRHSNIILIDCSTGKILDALKRMPLDEIHTRQILPGQPYIYPPAQGKIPFDKITPDEIRSFHQEDDMSQILLSNIQGISPLIARELCHDSIVPEDISEKLSHINKMLDDRDFLPSVYLNEKKQPVDFHVIPLIEYVRRFSPVPFKTVSETLEWYYMHRDSSNRIKQKSSSLTRTINASLKKLRLKKQRLSEDLLKAQNADKYKLYGELLTANIHKCNTGDKEVSVLNYYNQSPVTIPLDERYAPARNAQLYFKKYSKAKRAVKEKQKQLDETDSDIQYLESVSENIDRAESTEVIDAIREELSSTGFVRLKKNSRRGKAVSEVRPFSYTTTDGMQILAGRNNRENDILTLKTAGKKDYWFHTKDIPGSHVILFTKGKVPSEKSIYESASIAAYHSKGRLSENVPVDYTEIRNVKKPSGAKPGMVIFTDNKTVYVNPKVPSEK